MDVWEPRLVGQEESRFEELFWLLEAAFADASPMGSSASLKAPRT